MQLNFKRHLNESMRFTSRARASHVLQVTSVLGVFNRTMMAIGQCSLRTLASKIEGDNICQLFASFIRIGLSGRQAHKQDSLLVLL